MDDHRDDTYEETALEEEKKPETQDGKKDDSGNDYEDVCFICRRPESKAGRCLNCPIISVSATTVCIRPWIRSASLIIRGF